MHKILNGETPQYTLYEILPDVNTNNHFTLRNQRPFTPQHAMLIYIKTSLLLILLTVQF